MTKTVVSLHDQSVEIRYPQTLKAEIGLLFGKQAAHRGPASHVISIRADGKDRYALGVDSSFEWNDLSIDHLLAALLDEVVRALVLDLNSAVALHSAAVGWGDKSILIAGPSGAGKTSLVAWFIAKGFTFLSDELVILTDGGATISALPRPLVVKAGSKEAVASLSANLGKIRTISAGAETMICPPDATRARKKQPRPLLIIFPHYLEGAGCQVTSMSSAQTGLKLMECNINARNLSDHGFGPVTQFARSVAAIELRYGNYEQLDGVADLLAKTVLEGNFDAGATRKFLSAFHSSRALHVRDGGKAAATPAPGAEIPGPTVARYAKKLTIGMATYDDFDGVYFTLQALRFYHPEILDDTEFLVVDNHPGGPAAQTLKNFEKWIPNYRYVPKNERMGTTAREFVFSEASSEFVLCLDCHVLVMRGAVKRLIDYCDANRDTKDLLQGPLVYDNLTTIATHWKPEWRSGMYGVWECAPEASDPDAPPLDIPMQGLGLFACRRAAWPGFNPHFRGFGGEEGYVHEKFRQAGGRTLCLPFLRWVHRFGRPMGPPYVNTWDDRVRNYLIGFRELGLDTAPLEEHFKEYLGGNAALRIIQNANREINSNIYASRPIKTASRNAGDPQSERTIETAPRPLARVLNGRKHRADSKRSRISSLRR